MMSEINITNGKLIWATPFIAQGTVLKNAKIPDTFDHGASGGNTISNVKFDNGTQKKIVFIYGAKEYQEGKVRNL